ncbi:MAG TPA: hypothetical protein VGD28_00245 [Sphingomonas sp.]
MRTAFLFGAIALAGSAAAGVTLAQSVEPAPAKPVCETVGEKPEPSPSAAARQGPRATATVKNGGQATKRPGNTKWGNIVLKRGVDAAGCSKA